jgi:hypothetical protein
MARVRIETIIQAPLATCTAHLQTPALLRHVAAPLIGFISREPGGFPAVWEPGPHRVWMLAFGFLPLGPQTVDISHGDWSAETVWVRDNGAGLLVRRWDHRIEMTADGPDRTRYVDQVDIEAGLLTPLVQAYAALFYRWRQARWRGLARSGFRALSGG